MADISALGNLAPSEALDLDGYQLSTGAPKPFPRKGRYTLRARESFPADAFGKSKADALTVQIDPTIVGPTNEGFQLRFTRVSAKVYERGGVKVSQLGDYLKACGVTGRLSTPQEQANAAEATANLTFEAYLDWRLYAKGEGRDDEGNPTGTDLIISGMENFPKDEDGNPRPYVGSVIGRVDADGNPFVYRANLEIKRFVAKV